MPNFTTPRPGNGGRCFHPGDDRMPNASVSPCFYPGDDDNGAPAARSVAPVSPCFHPGDVRVCFHPGDDRVCFHPGDHRAPSAGGSPSDRGEGGCCFHPGDDEAGPVDMCFHPGDDLADDLHLALGADERELAVLADRRP